MRVGRQSTLIGASDVFVAFFSTICVRLEDGEWGSRFPVIMSRLYKGSLAPILAKKAIDELETIRVELAKLPPREVVWSIEDRSLTPPPGSGIAETITSLANYFVTPDGKNLIEQLEGAFVQCKLTGESVEFGYGCSSRSPLDSSP